MQLYRNRAERTLKRLGWSEMEIYGTKGEQLKDMVVEKAAASLFEGAK